MNNHGSYHYITAAESTGLRLLLLMSFAAILGAAIMPKDRILPPAMLPWQAYTAPEYGAPDLTSRQVAFFVCCLLFLVAAIHLLGPAIVEFLVSHGIILHD